MQTKNSNFGAFTLTMTVVCMLTLGIQFVFLNPLGPVFQETFNKTYQKRYNETLPPLTWIALLSWSSSAIIIGAAVGALSVGIMLMFMSRKRLLQVCHMLSLIGILIFTLVGKVTSSYEPIIIGRIVSGIAVGTGFIIIPIIVAEMCTQERQSFWLCISSSAFALGVLLGAVVTHAKVLGTNKLWPVAMGLAALPNITYLLISHKIPNTPFYLARQGDKDKTMAVLKKLRIGSQAELTKEYVEIVNEIKGKKTIGLLEIFKTKQYRMQFVNVCCLYAHIQFTGMTAILLYSDRISKLAGVADDQITNVTIGLFAGRFFASIVGLKFVDLYGGRKVLLTSSVIEILALALFTVSQATTHLAPGVMPYISVSGVAIYLIFFSGGTFLAAPSIAAAITIEPTRSTILGMAVVLFWVLAWFVGFITPYLEVVLGAYSFTPWIGSTIILFVYFITFLPETKGKSVEQIQAKLTSRTSKSIRCAASRKNQASLKTIA